MYAYGANNPVRYTDPDGRIQRHSDQSIIFYPNKDISTEIGNSGFEIKVQWGIIKAIDGTNIDIRINNSSKIFLENFNCHGYTFTNGIGWVQPNQVNALLKGDGYEETEIPVVNGIFVQYDQQHDAFHSGKIISYDKDSQTIIAIEAMGAILFKCKDGKIRKVREYTYKLEEMGDVKFFKNEGDKVGD